MKNKPKTTISHNRAYVQRISLCGMLTALMLVLGYLESRIPLVPAMPGIKLGLSNAVLLYAVCLLPAPVTFLLMIIKVLLSALLFGNPYALAFSLAGGLFSCLGMLPAQRFGKFGLVGVSVIGGVLHNAGQMLVALWLVGNMNILYYGAVLLLTGVGTGILTGVTAGVVIKTVKPKK